MKKIHAAPAPRFVPVLTAHEGGRIQREADAVRMASTVIILDIDDEEARHWDAEVARRLRR